MENHFKAQRKKAGFSLIELSVAIAVLGLIIYTTLAIFAERSAIDKIAVTERKLDDIQKALRGYYLQNTSLPCPANGMVALDNAAFGVSDCSGGDAGMAALDTNKAWLGVVPTRELNLRDDYMFDAWGNRISYAVSQEHANDSSPNWGADATLEIIDEQENVNCSASENDCNAVYVVFSHGKNGVGAWRRNGGAAKIPNTGLGMVEERNANADSSGANSAMDVTFADAPIIDAISATLVVEYFDDIVRWKTKEMIEYDADRLP